MAKKFKIVVDGVEHIVDVEELAQGAVVSNAPSAPVQQSVSSSGKAVLAPLQGTLQTLKVKIGQTVKEGDVIAIIEAMKMENDVPSTYSGVVKNILVSEGQKVESGQPIIEF